MLEQVARDQLLFQRVAVEERFPGPDLGLHRRRQRRGRLRRCAGGQPPFDQRELGVFDRRHSVGHPPQRLMLLVLRLLFQPGAFSFGVERQLEGRRQQAAGWCRVPALLRQQLIQQAAREVRVAGLAALIQHREEAALAPARRGAGVLVQPGELGLAHPDLVTGSFEAPRRFRPSSPSSAGRRRRSRRDRRRNGVRTAAGSLVRTRRRRARAPDAGRTSPGSASRTCH